MVPCKLVKQAAWRKQTNLREMEGLVDPISFSNIGDPDGNSALQSNRFLAVHIKRRKADREQGQGRICSDKSAFAVSFGMQQRCADARRTSYT